MPGWSGGSSLDGTGFALEGLNPEGGLRLDAACFSGGGVDLMGGSNAFPESGSLPSLLESLNDLLEPPKEEGGCLAGGCVVVPN